MAIESPNPTDAPRVNGHAKTRPGLAPLNVSRHLTSILLRASIAALTATRTVMPAAIQAQNNHDEVTEAYSPSRNLEVWPGMFRPFQTERVPLRHKGLPSGADAQSWMPSLIVRVLALMR